MLVSRKESVGERLDYLPDTEMLKMLPEKFTVKDVCEILHVNPTRARKLIRRWAKLGYIVQEGHIGPGKIWVKIPEMIMFSREIKEYGLYKSFSESGE